MPNNNSKTEAKSAKSEDSDDSKHVTMSVVRELLQVQERMFKSFVETITSDLTKRVDGLVQQVSDLKASLEYSQNDIDEHKYKLESMEYHLRDIGGDIYNMQGSIGYQRDKLEYIENQSRRNNIRVTGIEEEEGETWEKTEIKVKEIFKGKLDLDVDIERAHRVGKKSTTTSGQQSTRPRIIVCRIRDWKQKEEILRRARKRKPKGLFVNEDIAAETLQKRKDQLPKLVEARKAGKIAYFILDRLVIKTRPTGAGHR